MASNYYYSPPPPQSSDEVEFLNYWLRNKPKPNTEASSNTSGPSLRRMSGYEYYAKFCEQYINQIKRSKKGNLARKIYVS